MAIPAIFTREIIKERQKCYCYLYSSTRQGLKTTWYCIEHENLGRPTEGINRRYRWYDDSQALSDVVR